MSVTKEKNGDKSLDKNLQDDWVPDQQRRAGATSSQITEFGGNLKQKDSLKNNEEITKSHEKQVKLKAEKKQEQE
jgi:hypothetical protein